MSITDNSFSVGFFLATRDIKRSNLWTTALIIFVICLTFFNMLFLGGIMIGFVQAEIKTYPQYYSGDLFIIPEVNKNDIADTNTVDALIRSIPSFHALSNRSITNGLLEYNYENKIRATDLPESASGQVAGIDPIAEDKVSHLSGAMLAGYYLNPSDADAIIVGSNLMKKYASIRGAVLAVGSKILQTAVVGSRVRLTINGVQKIVTIKGVFLTNSVSVDSRIYMVDTAFREMAGDTSLNASEIAVKLSEGASAAEAKKYMLTNLKDNHDVIVQTGSEALPGSLSTIIESLNKLSSIVGAIALMVSAVTIFIVIFVNAVTRRKFIGILKGIGISQRAIEFSYVFQALFYAVSGVVISSIFILGLLKPYFDIHPIELASIHASLEIGMSDVIPNAITLTITAIISGFIPAWLVVRQNTLDAILGR